MRSGVDFSSELGSTVGRVWPIALASEIEGRPRSSLI